MSEFTVVVGDWHSLQQHAQHIRELVFILEQDIAPEDEWDDQDPISTHFVVYDADQPIATARLLSNDHVGRVAVLKEYRSKGIGKLVMQEIIALAKQQQRKELILSSQVHATQFYSGLGFAVQGESYLDCGIPHVDMVMTL
ncbi:GNAT family N-acetyltransferase [Acinetobacter pullicarnis]|uniref:GNAT family N-acetyltransferase n=1 Tax=Acinetobacter pullicarnis TaxID=2576829 RepID=UPI00111F92A8|nr:GNAT family N-acetyltransferase [Acinetobacter pullicarnis]